MVIKNIIYASSTGFKPEGTNRVFTIPSTVIINNVYSSYPKSIFIYLPHENNGRMKVPLHSAVLLPAFSKATKLLVQKAYRKTGKRWIKQQ